jgi:hypothetical protein
LFRAAKGSAAVRGVFPFPLTVYEFIVSMFRKCLKIVAEMLKINQSFEKKPAKHCKHRVRFFQGSLQSIYLMT